MPNIRKEASKIQNHTERVEFRYMAIEWTYLDGNVIFKDGWKDY
jgi:type VI protein secretion system component Hcp